MGYSTLNERKCFTVRVLVLEGRVIVKSSEEFVHANDFHHARWTASCFFGPDCDFEILKYNRLEDD